MSDVSVGRLATDDELTDDELADLLERRPVVDWTPFIAIDPAVTFGKPVIAGTRIAVEFVLDLFAGGWTEETVLEGYPHLTHESIRAAFAYAADLAHERQQRPDWMTARGSDVPLPR